MESKESKESKELKDCELNELWTESKEHGEGGVVHVL
jgi:hypothetical protein